MTIFIYLEIISMIATYCDKCEIKIAWGLSLSSSGPGGTT